MNAGFRL